MRLGWFGGSFDPPHTGHVSMAIQLVERYGFDCIWFMPTGISHMKQTTSARHRLSMLKLSLSNHKYPLYIDERELARPGTSYTIDSLREIAAEYRNDHRNFVLGADAYAGIDSWREGAQLIDYANLVVVDRGAGGWQNNSVTPETWAQASTGSVFHPRIDKNDISSTNIRKAYAQGNLSAIQSMVEPEVAAYIQQEKLYQNH